jgi:serine/threonine protein phosphatase PrpC
VAFSTEDHRPLRPRERERIYDAGGTIRRRRVEGSLAVSRALGDFAFKEARGRPPELQLVSAEPEVAALARQAEDEFMLLASDGVWDTMSGAALVGLVASRLRLGMTPELLCAQLLDTCLCKVLEAAHGIVETGASEGKHLSVWGRRGFDGEARGVDALGGVVC